MTDILTITLNPALDIATSCDTLLPSHKLRCAHAEHFPGGGGINVARVVQRLGGDCLALYLAGGTVGNRLQELIQAEQVPSHRLQIADETRESFSVLESSTGREYRFVLPGPTLSAQEWQACVDYLGAMEPAPRYVVLSGSLPPGVSVDSYAQLAGVAHARGARVVLDSSGAPLAAALDHGVYLIKPSRRELSELTGAHPEDETQWCAAAESVLRDGRAELVALSLGERGAMLFSAEGAWRADALQVDVKSTTGAGDSFLAAMVWALNQDFTLPAAFRYGVAAGTAALLHAGTTLCRADDVARLVRQVHVAAMSSDLH
ncbi:MAG: 1-phosphofructokinase family hexose kinase [Burkholderiaceae bacterium]